MSMIGPAPRLIRVTLARSRMEIVQFAREREAKLFTFALPILVYSLFAVTMTGDLVVNGHRVSHRLYMLPGLVAAGVMLTSFQSTAVALAADRGSGGLKRLRTTPLPPTAFFLGKVALVLVSSAAQAALLLVVARLLFDTGGPQSWARFAWVYLLGCVSGTTIGIAFSSLLRNPRSAPTVVASTTLVLQFVCGVFFVFPTLPAWIQNAAHVLPLTWLARGMRSAFLPEHLALVESTGQWQPGWTAAILSAWALAGLAVSMRTFRWTLR